MPGQRIYYVPPRLVGSVSEWSGMDTADGASWLVDRAADLGFNGIWFSPMCETTKVKKQSHGKTLTGSYYATRNHFRLDDEFSCGDPDSDLDHLEHFCAKAAEKGIRVYADLVFNHVAADHPLVEAENAAIADILRKSGGVGHPIRGHKNKLVGFSYPEGAEEKTFYFKFRRNSDFSLLAGGPPEDPWTDVAQINYASPEARKFFVEGYPGQKGYFKKVIDGYIDCGFSGFRCDVAYMIPPETWQELISYARSRLPDTIFLAETLGGPDTKIERLADAIVTDSTGKQRPAFDLGMLGFYWWNMQDAWLPEQEGPRAQRMSKFGGAGAPDNHDTEGTLAGNLSRAFNGSSCKDRMISEICVRDYALSVLACNSSYMQMGYEYSNEKQNGVFKGMVGPEDWKNLTKRNGLETDLRDQIRAINQLKEDLHAENCKVVFKECVEKQGGRLIKIHCEYIDVDTNKKMADVVLLVNRNPELGDAQLKDMILTRAEKEGLDKLHFGSDENSVSSVVIYHTPVNKKGQPASKPVPPSRKNYPMIKKG